MSAPRLKIGDPGWIEAILKEFPQGLEERKPKETLSPDSEYKEGKPRPHHCFYIEGGDMILQVNNALFKLHRHFLVKHSVMIRDMLDLPRPQGPNTLVNEPIVKLSGDTVKGWETMMELFYPENPCLPHNFSAEKWADILLLAHKYLMDGIELSALRQLQNAKPALDMVDLMVVAQTVGSEELYQKALQSLAQRDQMLSLEEAQKIGLRAFHEVMTTEHVYYVRQRRPGVGVRRPTTVAAMTLEELDGIDDY